MLWEGEVIKAVAQQHELWVGPRQVFHHQVVAADRVKGDSDGQRQVGSPGGLVDVDTTWSAQVGQDPHLHMRKLGFKEEGLLSVLLGNFPGCL